MIAENLSDLWLSLPPLHSAIREPKHQESNRPSISTSTMKLWMSNLLAYQLSWFLFNKIPSSPNNFRGQHHPSFSDGTEPLNASVVVDPHVLERERESAAKLHQLRSVCIFIEGGGRGFRFTHSLWAIHGCCISNSPKSHLFCQTLRNRCLPL